MNSIHLDFRYEGPVVITPSDQDRFVTTAQEAAEACRAFRNYDEWLKEFQLFLGHIYHWCARHAGVVQRCYFGLSAEGMNVVVVTKGPDYRTDFDDQITALDIEFADRFQHCPVDVIQSPEDDPDATIPYVAPEKVMHVYGEPNRSPDQGRS